jgi:pimeloyl-ACP methyl ester carboxylesterase
LVAGLQSGSDGSLQSLSPMQATHTPASFSHTPASPQGLAPEQPITHAPARQIDPAAQSVSPTQGPQVFVFVSQCAFSGGHTPHTPASTLLFMSCREVVEALGQPASSASGEASSKAAARGVKRMPGNYHAGAGSSTPWGVTRSPSPDGPDGLVSDRQHAATRDGWLLDLKRTYSPAHFRPDTRPLVIIPGYGMNAFIFGFHPRGTSMERALAEAGFEVWSANLRRQGASRAASEGAPGPSLRAYAEQDVRAIVDTVVAGTRTGFRAVSIIGASLGGSIAYAYLALHDEPRVHSLVAIGSPLQWREVHPALRLAFSSPRLVGALAFSGTRNLARVGLRALTRYPSLLSIYMNAGHVDLSAASTLVETVEDPIPRVNADIARWMKARDMVLGGVNVTRALARVDLPLLLVVSNRDGIVPESANLAVQDAWGGRDVEILRVGDERDWYAHADLFVSHQSAEKVFAPIARWLHERNG